MSEGRQPLLDKVAIVTGASSGIGRAIAQALSAAGARLVISGRSESRLKETARQLRGDVAQIVGDLTASGGPERLVEAALEHFSCIDIVIANAGIYLQGPVASGNAADWETLIQTNVTSVFRLVRAVLDPMMAANYGDVLVMSSISGHQALSWEPIYSASKHALQAFAQGLRVQLIPYNIRVMSVAPGRVCSELWGGTAPDPVDALQKRSWILCEDVADAVLYGLTRPRHVTVRDLVILPSAQGI